MRAGATDNEVQTDRKTNISVQISAVRITMAADTSLLGGGIQSTTTPLPRGLGHPHPHPLRFTGCELDWPCAFHPRFIS